MQNDVAVVTVGASLMGVLLIAIGLWIPLGINRSWWQWRILPLQEGYFWAAIPAGTDIGMKDPRTFFGRH